MGRTVTVGLGLNALGPRNLPEDHLKALSGFLRTRPHRGAPSPVWDLNAACRQTPQEHNTRPSAEPQPLARGSSVRRTGHARSPQHLPPEAGGCPRGRSAGPVTALREMTRASESLRPHASDAGGPTLPCPSPPPPAARAPARRTWGLLTPAGRYVTQGRACRKAASGFQQEGEDEGLSHAAGHARGESGAQTEQPRSGRGSEDHL